MPAALFPITEGGGQGQWALCSKEQCLSIGLVLSELTVARESPFVNLTLWENLNWMQLTGCN